MPAAFADDTALNARSDSERARFHVAEHSEKPVPSPEKVKANRRKWGLAS